MKPIFTNSKKEAKKLLKIKGSKVVVEINFAGCFVFAEKSDFIKEIINKSESEIFTDYDGEEREIEFSENVMYVRIGTH